MEQIRFQRNEIGASTAEYAAVTCGGVGLAGVLIKMLTSDFGQALIKGIFDHVMDMLPF